MFWRCFRIMVMGAGCMAVALSTTISCAEDAKPAAPSGVRRALLIGCSDYYHLGAHKLVGPPNDVALMTRMLTKRFEFKDENIRAMTEESAPEFRPKFENIRREFERLAGESQPGDRVFILLSGHGSQQPVDPATADADNFEVDGLDEVFLPADTTVDKDRTHFQNAVTDNQLRAWLRAIQSKNAGVFLVVDACHSGSMVRGVGAETVREIKAEEVFTPQTLQLARAGASTRSTEPQQAHPAPFRLSPDEPNLVAIYAAQATEPTIELDLPLPTLFSSKVRDVKKYGLLTFTINQVVTSSVEPLTYTELVQRVRSYYAGIGLSFPTPMVEGKHRDQFLFSDERPVQRPAILLQRDTSGVWSVNAGELQGLAEGTILAVYPPAGRREADKPIGYLRVLNDGLSLDSTNVEPCAHAGVPSPTMLYKGMRCSIAQVQCSATPCRVAVDDRVGMETLTPADKSGADPLADLRGAVKSLEGKSPLVKPVDDTSEADCVVRRLKNDSSDAYLVPSGGFAVRGDNASPTRFFGPIPKENSADWLLDRLTRIQRANNLRRLAERMQRLPSDGASSLDVRVLKLRDSSDETGTPISGDLHAGDRIGIQIANTGSAPVDVTVLFIDSGYGIDLYFPKSPGIDNRLTPKSPPLKLRGKITAHTLGCEQLLVIATVPKANAPPSSFAFLSQPTIEQARAFDLTRAGEAGIGSGLGQVFQALAYGGETRGLSGDDVATTLLRLVSWRVSSE